MLIPRTSREHRWATWTAINAGVTEEIVARGYLLWYLQQFVGPWTAWGLAVLVFTFAHIYQGPRHLPGIAVASATLVGLFLLAGSLWPVMVLHIVGDLLQLAGLSEARMKHGAAARDGSERSGPSALPA